MSALAKSGHLGAAVWSLALLAHLVVALRLLALLDVFGR